jgi:hypothetical protein
MARVRNAGVGLPVPIERVCPSLSLPLTFLKIIMLQVVTGSLGKVFLVQRDAKTTNWSWEPDRMLTLGPYYSLRSTTSCHHAYPNPSLFRSVDRIDPKFSANMGKFFRVCETTIGHHDA